MHDDSDNLSRERIDSSLSGKMNFFCLAGIFLDEFCGEMRTSIPGIMTRLTVRLLSCSGRRQIQHSY